MVTAAKPFVSSTLLGLLSLVLLIPPKLSAQALEEIIVTAQRREQNLQEVPVSLEVLTGLDMQVKGIDALEDLAVFSPSVEMEFDVIRSQVSIRGMGSNGPNLAMEQSAAMFVDGVHFGRGSMYQGAYLDLERLEVLRGPQPVFFGQNATAGAFSLTTKKPGPEWEANVTAEVGNLGRKEIEGGIGGPITETLGIRVAAKVVRYDGHLIDIVDGSPFPYRKDNGGRITLQWTPTEAFQATLSATIQDSKNGGKGRVYCRSLGTPAMTEFATFVPGLVPAWDAVRRLPELPDCIEDGITRIGRKAGAANPYRPVLGISQSDQNFGIVDLTEVWASQYPRNPSLEGLFELDSKDYRLGLSYEFDNGITIDSTTAYVDYFRYGLEGGSTPIMTDVADRAETFDMVSQEVRIRSTSGGTFEWEAGAYWQQEDLDGNPSCDSRAGIRHPNRCNYPWQDAEWKNVFGSVTFNFMDNRAAIDLGARYSRVDKTASVRGTAGTLIFDINPDGPDMDGVVETLNGAANVTAQIIDCATGHRQCGSYGAGYWTHRWTNASGGSTRRVPDAWNAQAPVAFGPQLSGLRTNEAGGLDGLSGSYDTSSLDPQITLRYNINDDTSIYAKYVKAFKAGGFDTASRSLPDNFDKFQYGDEDAKSFEAGVKGTLMDNQVRYGVSAFRQRTYGLQQETNDPIQGSFITQAGLQETKGIEFDATWLVSDRMRASFGGALMDGTLVAFPGAGCTDVEFANADQTECISEDEAAALGNDNLTGTIDRSGYKAPRTPDWKFILDLNYWHPLYNNYKAILNVNTSYSDAYIHDVEGYSEITTWPKHVNMNITAGFGDIDDGWKISLYARNIFKARIVYRPENDIFPVGVEDAGKSNTVGSSQYFHYGLQMTYNYN
jgi:outer membrane receptor protein involved in Fe transport